MDLAKIYEFELEEFLYVKNGVLKYQIFVGNDDKSRDFLHCVLSHVINPTSRMYGDQFTVYNDTGFTQCLVLQVKVERD